MPVAIPGANSDVSVTGSKSIALSFFGEDQSEQGVSNSPEPFFFSIPRDTNLSLPSFEPLYNYNETKIKKIQEGNNTNRTHGPINLFLLNGFTISKRNVSIHYHIQPADESLGYFAAIKFGGNPYLNSTYQRFDMWKIFCPWRNFILSIT